MNEEHLAVACTDESLSTTRTERTRKAILQAADACFREFGFDAAKSTEIAQRAGVAEGTIFLHYVSKSGLLTVVTADLSDVIQAEAEKEVQASGDATRLRRLVNGWASRLETGSMVGHPASKPTGH